MAISRRVRFEVLRRDSYTCRYCGARAPDVVLTVDHVIPVTLGGSDDPANLVTACFDCNAGKASTSPDEHTVADVEASAQRWAQAMARAAEIRKDEQRALDEQLHQFIDYWDELFGDDIPHWSSGALPHDWAPTITRFLSLGLSIDELKRIALDVGSKTGVRKYFRYFCSFCWGEIERRQQLAEQLFEDDEGL